MNFHALFFFFLLGAEMSNICCCAVDIIVAKAMPSCVLIRLCMPCATPYLFSDPTWGGYICASIWIILVTIKTESVMCWNWQFRITLLPTFCYFYFGQQAWYLSLDFPVCSLGKNVFGCFQKFYLTSYFLVALPNKNVTKQWLSPKSKHKNMNEIKQTGLFQITLWGCVFSSHKFVNVDLLQVRTKKYAQTQANF